MTKENKERSKEEIAQEMKVTNFIKAIKDVEEKHGLALRPQMEFSPDGIRPKMSVVEIEVVEVESGDDKEK